MANFTKNQIAYLNEQLLGRLATVDTSGHPHAVPVSFHYNADADAIDIGGRALDRTAKFRRVQHHPYAAFVIDDLASTNPWRPRGIEIRGPVQTYQTGGESLGPGFGGAWMRIEPEHVFAWGIDPEPDAGSDR